MRWTWHVSCLEYLEAFVGNMPDHVLLAGHGAKPTAVPPPAAPSLSLLLAAAEAGDAWVGQLPGVRKDHSCLWFISQATHALFPD